MEVGELVGVGDDVDLEGVVGGITNREADPIDGDRTFIDSEIAPLRHLLVEVILEGKGIATLLVLLGSADCCLVDMSLHDVSVEPSIHHHAALHIDVVAHFEQPEVGTVERFLHGGDRVGAVLDFHYSEAHAIVRHTLVDLQLIYKRAFEMEIDVLLILVDSHYSGEFFYDS